jgi:hypothetical protein
MDSKSLEKIFSSERLQPYLKRHNYSFNKAIDHYRANILISEAFYPLISILEIGLRNGVILLLHMNWGWDGDYNGWYNYNNFNPGSHTFNYKRGMVYNIKP